MREPKHIHDSYQCPTHCWGCNCPNLEEWICNPYWVNEYCPDNLEVMPDDPRYVEIKEA